MSAREFLDTKAPISNSIEKAQAMLIKLQAMKSRLMESLE